MLTKDVDRKGVRADRERHNDISRVVKTPAECCVILMIAKSNVVTLLKHTGSLNRDQVAEVNRYFAAMICVQLGHCPGVVTNLAMKEYVRGEANRKTLEGQEYTILTVTQHKTAHKYPGRFCLDPFWTQMFADCVTNVRQPII